MNETNYKTLVPAVVGAGVLVYEASTGHVLDNNAVTQYTNALILIVSAVLTVWGVWKNHHKGGTK